VDRTITRLIPGAQLPPPRPFDHVKGLAARLAKRGIQPHDQPLLSPIRYRPGYRAGSAPGRPQPGYRPDHPEGRIPLPVHLCSTVYRPDLCGRDLQYHAVHKTRLRLMLANARVKSLRALARKIRMGTPDLSRVMSGREMPTLGTGLSIAAELNMDPYTFYAWLWERQQERAFWFPEERSMRPSKRNHPRPSVALVEPATRRPSPRASTLPMQPLPAPARPRSGHHGSVPPGGYDWRNYAPHKDPVYLRVMSHLAEHGLPSPHPPGSKKRARLDAFLESQSPHTRTP